MAQQECDDVKAMLEEMQAMGLKLKELTDSEGNLEEIKKTKEELQSVLHKHGILRYNLKEWERRSKKIQRIDKIVEKLKKEGNDVDFSIDELHAIYMTGVWKTKDGVFNFKPMLNKRYIKETYHKLTFCRKEVGVKKQKEDYTRIYGCKPEQATSEPDDVFRENSDIVVFIGDIDFTDEELPKTLKHVSGNLQSDSKNAKLPKNLEYVGGNLYLSPLTPAKELVLPETVGGDLSLRLLKKIPAKGLVLPKTVGGDLHLTSLTSAEGLLLPETVHGNLNLMSLKEIPAEGLKLPETVGRDLNLESLTSAKGLEKLNYASITGSIYLPKAFSAKERAKVEKIKTKQKEKGINVNFEYL